ncbi:MAG: hypothetical protein JNJ61_20000 [Anaerolineae bacterium]|nr:hypothetical protein [Anaerolineae bacterium]
MRQRLRGLIYVLLTGYILCYFSEWMFWSGRIPASSDPLAYIFPWLLYSFATYVFLIAVHYFRVRSLPAVFLAGAVYGWVVEGILVQTMYDSFPIHLSATGLSWHALISVVGGWYLMRRWMRRSSRHTLYGVLLFGLFVGFWSGGWWVEAPIAPVETVWLYNVILGAPLVLAYAGLERLGSAAFTPGRADYVAALAGLAAYFVLVTLPSQPLALIILPPAMALVVFLLHRSRKNEPEHSPDVQPAVPGLRFGLLLGIPLLASALYTLAYMLGFPIQTLTIVYAVTIPAGFVALLLSAFKIMRQRPLTP